MRTFKYREHEITYNCSDHVLMIYDPAGTKCKLYFVAHFNKSGGMTQALTACREDIDKWVLRDMNALHVWESIEEMQEDV